MDCEESACDESAVQAVERRDQRRMRWVPVFHGCAVHAAEFAESTYGTRLVSLSDAEADAKRVDICAMDGCPRKAHVSLGELRFCGDEHRKQWEFGIRKVRLYQRRRR